MEDRGGLCFGVAFGRLGAEVGLSGELGVEACREVLERMGGRLELPQRGGGQLVVRLPLSVDLAGAVAGGRVTA